MTELGQRLIQSEAQRRRAAMRDSLLMQAGFLDRDRDNEYLAMGPAAMAAECVERAGLPTLGLTQQGIVGLALAHGTSDFPRLFTEAMHVAALLGFNTAQEVYPRYTSRDSVTDFREFRKVGIGAFPSLLPVVEGAEFSYATFAEQSATYALVTQGRIVRVSRQAVVNDATGQLLNLARKSGAAAARAIGAGVANVLQSNPVMDDAEQLFSSAHANIAATPGAPTTELVGQMIALIERQTSNGVTLGLRPKFLIVPSSLAGIARVICAASWALSADGFLAETPNTIFGRLEVVSDPHLTGPAWYLACDPLVTDGIQVAYLNGIAEPRVEMARKFDTDGGAVKIALDSAIAPLDFRGLARNAGA